MEKHIPSHVTRTGFGSLIGDGMRVDPDSFKAYQTVNGLITELNLHKGPITGRVYLVLPDNSASVGLLDVGWRHVTFMRELSVVAIAEDITIEYELVEDTTSGIDITTVTALDAMTPLML